MPPARRSRPPALSSDQVLHFAAPAEAVWSAIGAVSHYQLWWPWLRRFEAERLAEGVVWRCRIRTPLRAALAFTIAIEHVEEPRLVVARLDGDLTGTARIDISPNDAGASVRLRSELEPRRRIVRTLARWLPPIARAAHDRVVSTAARQFAAGALSAA